MQKTLVLFVFVLAGVWALAASAQPLQPGDAVATCFSENDPNGFVVAVVGDIRNPSSAGAVVNQNWAAPMRKHPSWTRSKLGEVFGIALDDAPNPNVYLTSTSLYRRQFVYSQTAPGTGQVFKINGTTQVAAACGLPIDPLNKAAGLGNIAYDLDHQQLFVTNFRDGKIYRLDTTCQVKDTYDPFNPFNPAQNTLGGFAPLGERVWGVGVFEGRLYFSRWSRDQQSGPDNTIWSVPLDVTGKLIGAPFLELTLGGEPMPVADIEFASDGRMLLAQRGVDSQPQEVFTVPHQSHLLEFVGSSGSWAPSSNIFKVGDITSSFNTDNSSAGGADYICPATPEGGGGVVATGDALRFPNPAIYGLQIFPPTGGTSLNSFLIDLDGNIGAADKTEIGDVDVYNTCDRQCAQLTGVKVLCTTDGSGNFTVQFQVKNLSSAPVFHAFLVNLPAGVTATPNHFSLGAGLAPGQVSQVFQTTIHGAQPGQQLSFEVTVHDQNLMECCSARLTITLPQCNCAQVIKDKGPTCRFSPPFGFNYSFTLQNLFPQTPGFVLIVPVTPATATLSPNVIPFTGNPQNISLTIGNAPSGQQVCFLVSLHTEDFERCCSIRRCVTLPRCFDVFDDDLILSDSTNIFFNVDGLRLEHSGLKPGVRLPLAEGTTAFDTAWLPADAAALPIGGTLEQTVEGVVGDGGVETVARLGTTRTAAGAELRASFPGLDATSHRFEFYRNGERVGVQPGVSGDTPAICNCGPKITTDAHFSVRGSVSASQENAEPCDSTGPNCVFAGFTFPDANSFHLRGALINFVADEVRVIPENGSGTVRSLTAAEVRANGLASLTLTDFRTDQDCNSNGIPDYDEITRGGGLDLDLDGVLDSCAAPAALSVSLATGFDQAAGALLPPRSDDDDWRLVEPGAERPAAVIAQPHRTWPAPLSGSRWVGAEPERGASASGVPNYLYERCFCLSAGAREVTLDLRLKADDRARVLLNGQAVSDLGGGFRTEALAVRRTGAVGDGLFVAGENCVAVEVQDSGGTATGFTLEGLVTAPVGACRP